MNVDLIGKSGGSGDVANMIMSGGMNVNEMRPYIGGDGRTYMAAYSGKGDPNDLKNYTSVPIHVNGTLRRDEWKQLDEQVIKVAEKRLNGIQDLISRGLTYNLGNAMGTTVLEHHLMSDALEADVTMKGEARGKGDLLDYKTVYLPLPIIHVDYEIGARHLEASRKLGNPINTDMAERAGRRVGEKLENMLFTDIKYAFDGGSIYSYLNYPHRNLVTLSNYGNWDDSSTTPRAILESVKKMKQTLLDANQEGPFVLYIPSNYETEMDDDFEDTGNTTRGLTIRERILKIGGIEDIKVIHTLPDDEVLMVQMDSNTVRLVRGLGITNVQWQTEGRFVNKFKVFTIQVPQIRSDYNNKCGIVHMS